MKKYVVGFYFSTDRKNVILIKKNRPVECVGKINGVGGKVEENEEPYHAMVREFLEEAGLLIHSWDNYCRFYSEFYDINVYRSFGDQIPSSVTDEEVKWYSVEDILSNPEYKKFKSISWLIPMALDSELVAGTIQKSL